MSTVLNPAIDNLDKNSLCYYIYIQLYNNLFNAQDKKDKDHPFGIEEGDETSIRLKNTAYNFASPISESIVGNESGEGSGNEGVLAKYVKKDGDNMLGLLRANYGFEAGVNNTRVIYISQKNILDDQQQIIGTDYETNINGNIKIGGNNFFLDDKRVVSYNKSSDTTILSSSYIDFKDSSIKISGDVTVGLDKASGIYISPSMLQVKGNNVYHAGNANRKDIDWKMNNAFVSNDLNITGNAQLHGTLTSCNGVYLGAKGKTLMSITQNEIDVSGFISFGGEHGIKIEGVPILIRVKENDIQIGSIGGDLVLGNDKTKKIKLLAGISDENGNNVLLTKFGEAFFPGSLRVKHNLGDDLMSTYRVDATDEGLIIHKKLRFGTSLGAYFTGDNDNIKFISVVRRSDPSTHTETINTYNTVFQYQPSTSVYQPQNRESDSFAIITSSDYFLFNKPVESKDSIGIVGSSTRLLNNSLFFTNKSYLHSINDGIKHYGNAYFIEDLSSENFSSGFAGSGWAIKRNKTTGNTIITCDEAVFRKKVRIYEMEVQKTTATNGSLWISDTCSGDSVEKL